MISPLKAFGKHVLDRHYRSNVQNNVEGSIICSNCIGGVLYNHLGQEFKSPTVNLYIKQNDFIRLCCNLKYYMSLDIEFVETDLNHPVGKIGDVTIYFNHDSNESEAAAKWYRRRERIDYEKLFFIFYYGDSLTEDDVSRLDNVPCLNKVMLSPEPLDWKSISYISYFDPAGSDSLSMRGMDQDIFGIRSIERKFDFARFLNDGFSKLC